MHRGFWLTDEQFSLIKPYLPFRSADRQREDDQRMISGIIHILQSGCRSRDCPAEYGTICLPNWRRLKDFRRIAIRYDKNAVNDMTALGLPTLTCYWGFE